MNKALFLDRDGVINADHGYVYKNEDCKFIDGIFEFCQKAKAKGYLIIIVTNQAGIARGYYTIEDFRKLTNFIESEFKKKGINITKTYFCPFHEDGIVPEYSRASFDRKPNPGMILQAQNEFNIDLSKSVLIGDKESDIQAAKNAAIGSSFLFDHTSNNILSKINDWL